MVLQYVIFLLPNREYRSEKMTVPLKQYSTFYNFILSLVYTHASKCRIYSEIHIIYRAY